MTKVQNPPIMPETINYAYNEPQVVEPEIVEQPETKVEPEVPEVKVPETKVEETKVEPKAEVKEEPKEEAQVVEKPEEVTAADWKKVLKDTNPDKYEVLKEMGYDDFTIGMLKYKEQTGDYTPYLEVKTVDYTKMSSEQIIKMDMQKKYPGISEKALNIKFNKELNEKYYLNRDDYPEDSDEAVLGQELLRLESEQIRKQFIENQQKFKAPEPQPDLDATNREAELQRQRASVGEGVMNNPVTKSLQANKYITFGKGEESFNYPVGDVQSLVDTALNSIVNSGYTDISKLNMEVFYKQLLIGKDMEAYEKAFADHIHNLDKLRFQNEMHNTTPVNNSVPDAPLPKKDYAYRG